MAKKNEYAEWLKAEFGSLIEALDLDPRHKQFLKSRWLDQVVWVEGKANQARDRYYRLRLITVVGAVLLPALVSVSASGDLGSGVRALTWAVSLVVAVSAAVEEFFRFGDRWRNYRLTAERLKTEGWLFFQLSGHYSADGSTHKDAYPVFAKRVEELIQADVDTYLTQVAVEKKKEKENVQAR